MKCDKCKCDKSPLEYAYNKNYGWICNDCAKEVGLTIDNLFTKLINEDILNKRINN